MPYPILIISRRQEREAEAANKASVLWTEQQSELNSANLFIAVASAFLIQEQEYCPRPLLILFSAPA